MHCVPTWRAPPTRREYREYCNIAVEIPPHDLVRNVGGRALACARQLLSNRVRWIMRVIGVGAMQVSVCSVSPPPRSRYGSL